jgi:hypothetical protein
MDVEMYPEIDPEADVYKKTFFRFLSRFWLPFVFEVSKNAKKCQ